MSNRVVVTGIGVVSVCGIGVDNFFAGLFRDPPPGKQLTVNFDAQSYFDPKTIKRNDRFTLFTLLSAREAVKSAGLADTDDLPGRLGLDPLKCATILGSGIGGISSLEDQIVKRYEGGDRKVSPFLVTMMMANAAGATLSIIYNLKGPNETTTTACASSTHALYNAYKLIASGEADFVISGGAEAALTPTAIAAFSNMTALTTSGRSRPFDAERDGFVIAEGAAILVLENLDCAKERNAPIYCEILGGASTSDAFHITAPAERGSGAISCMELALKNANLEPREIGHINAHGTSTPLNDLAEAQAISKVFDNLKIPVTSIKGAVGHALGAAGAIEAVACILTIKNKLIPPTKGLANLDPEITIDVVTGEGREFTPAPILSNSFGFGGHNGCLVIAPY